MKFPVTDSHSFSNHPNTEKTDMFTFLWFMDEFSSETKSITKSFLNKLKHIAHWSLNERFSGTLNESNKKIGIFRLKENSPSSL